MRAAALCLILLAACNGDTPEPWTWGEFSYELAEPYCAANARCGYVDDESVCTSHVVWHLCEPDHACGLAVNRPDEARVWLDACTVALAEYDDCLALYWGILPDACYGADDWRPVVEPDAG